MFTHNIYRNIRTRVIIVHDGKMLFNAPGPDAAGRGMHYRCLPGGGLEPNETLYGCGEREVMEETGLRVQIQSVAFLREWVIPLNVSVDAAKKAIDWAPIRDTDCPDHAYGLEVYLWARLLDDRPAPLQLKDGEGGQGEWLPLEQMDDEPLFPCELRALARDLLQGRTPAGVPSFATGLGTPHDKPDYQAFRRF